MKTLTFSGYEWDVRASGTGGPGPNIWDDNNAYVDRAGRLHLQLTTVTNTSGNAEWHCVELATQLRLGFGRCQFQLIGRIDQLDRNVVLGLFKYPTPDVGPDGTNEIDIEFAQWGRATGNNADYVVFPQSPPRAHGDNVEFAVALHGSYTTHRVLWQSTQVGLQSLAGHRDDDNNEIQSWQYAPSDTRLIPQLPTPVRMNLWLFRGMAPSNGEEVEIVISQFGFTPFDPPGD
jgi:hypothetical protein